MKLPSLAMFLSFLAMLSVARAAGPEELAIAIIGDSTVCDYPPEHACRGWGQFIAEHFSENVRVLNLAASGRSTKTFIAEGRWKRTLAEKPDVVLIQFGHNDSHGPGKPESTDAATDYRDFLRRYVDDSRAANATPIFVTPMYRRTFDEAGNLADILQPYADAMKVVAVEKKVPLIDLHTSSGALFRKLGKEHCPELANSPTDFTHFNEKGARAMAALVMKELPAAAPQLDRWARKGPATGK
jgi:lysophospholipase L1-like esterase